MFISSISELEVDECLNTLLAAVSASSDGTCYWMGELVWSWADVGSYSCWGEDARFISSLREPKDCLFPKVFRKEPVLLRLSTDGNKLRKFVKLFSLDWPLSITLSICTLLALWISKFYCSVLSCWLTIFDSIIASWLFSSCYDWF